MENIGNILEKILLESFRNIDPKGMKEIEEIEEIANDKGKRLEFFKGKTIKTIISLIFKTTTGEEQDPLSKIIMNTPEKKIEFIAYTVAHYGMALEEKFEKVFNQIESIKNLIDKKKDPDLFLMVENLEELLKYL